MREFFSKYQIEDEVIAAGVSGGADSLALVLRLKDCGKKVVALTVDHGLRPESGAEAAYVAKLMQENGIEHHILVWEGDKPTSDIEAEARSARYNLLCGWCNEHGIRVLAIGQHRRDQAETFLLRLQRGSGLYGLSGILPVSERGTLTVIRPQLDDTPEMLRDYLRSRQIEWVEDPSNQCDDFQRVKIRKFLPELERKIGLTVERLAETAAVLSRTRSYMEEQTNRLIKNHVCRWDGVLVSLSREFVLSLHPEMRYRVLAVLIKETGGRLYTPEADEMLRLGEELAKDSFKGCTLGDCEIFIAQKRLWIIPELKKKTVLSKKQWEDFSSFFPAYAKAALPYKVRQALYNRLANI